MIKSLRTTILLLIAIPCMCQETFSTNWDPCGFAFEIGEPIVFWVDEYESMPWVDFLWDFGDGNTGQGFTVTHSYLEPGVFLMGVTGIDDSGAHGESFFILFFVNAPGGNPNVDVWIEFPETDELIALAGSHLEFRAASSASNATFYWQLAGTDLVGEGDTFELDIPPDIDNEKFWLEAFAVNDDGIATDWPAGLDLYVYQSNHPPDTLLLSPELPADGTLRGRLGETLRLQVTGEDIDGHYPLEFFWYGESESGSFDAQGDILDYPLNEVGWHAIGVWAVDSLGREDPYPFELGIRVKDENHPPEVWIEDCARTLFAGETMTLHANGYDPDGDPISYFWDFGDGRSATGQEVDVFYSDVGPYRVVLTGEDADGLAGTFGYELWLMVNPAEPVMTNQAPNPEIIAPAPGDMFPFGSEIQFQGFGWDLEETDLTFFWGFDDGTLVQGDSATHTFDEAICDADQPCVLWPYLFVRDGGGLFSWWEDSIPIALYSGERPPNGIIQSPQASVPPGDPYGLPVFQLKPGESLQLRGGVEGTSTDGHRGRWVILHWSGDETFQLSLEGFEPDPIPFESFPEGGEYEVQLNVEKIDGKEDPIAAFLGLWIRDTNVPPQAEIIEPGWDLAITVGDHLDLAACGYDEDGDAIDFHWQLSDGRTFEGDRVEYVPFESPGIHWIALSAIDTEGGSAPVPYRIFVIVNAEFDPDIQHPPDLIPLSPLDEELIGAPRSQYYFSCDGIDYFGESITQYHWDFGNGQTSNLATPGNVTFSQPGLHIVRAFAKNTSELWSLYPLTWVVYIYGDNIPPQSEIINPPLRDHTDLYLRHSFPVLMGTQVTLTGDVFDQDGHFPLSVEWFLDGELLSTSLNPDPIVFSERAVHWLELSVADNLDLWDPFPDYRVVQVADPSLKPESYIAWPDGDLTIEPGEDLYFFGFGEDPNELELSHLWNFGSNATPATAQTEEVYPVYFNQETPPGQPYEVTFQTSTQFTQDDTPARVRITVKQYEDTDFEPNNSISEAPMIQKGTYSNLSLGLNGADDADFFRFHVDQDGRDMTIRLAPDSDQASLVVELYRYDDGTWEPQGFGTTPITRNTFTLENMPSGDYAIEVRLPEAEKNRRDPLSYGMGVNTLQPSIYLPFLVDDGNLVSSLGLINPYDEEVDLAIVGLDELGQTIETKSISLPPHGRLFKTSADLFGTRNKVELSREIVWAKVQATQRLVGYVLAESRDNSQLICSGGIVSLAPSVIVPHIAEKTNQWYTRAITINGAELTPAVDFEAASVVQEISGQASNSAQNDFRFSEIFSSELPQWGRFVTRNREASLAGMEIFGRRDGAREMAGLEMVYERDGNPNFVHLDQEIFFSHVAKDTANFWTGIALINLGTSAATMQIIGYGDDGSEITRINDLALAPQGKLLTTVSDLFDGVQDVSWIRVLTTNQTAGFELFGDHQSTRLAGFQAPRFTTDDLFFPHIRVEENAYWTGIALLNMGDTAVNLTIEGYDDKGTRTGSVTQVLAARTKLVRSAEQLFPGSVLPSGTSYIRVQGDQTTLNGFELIGTLRSSGALGEQMAGILALAL